MYDPVKEKLTREINKRCEEKLQRAKVKKVKHPIIIFLLHLCLEI